MKTILVKISNPQQEKVLTEFLEQHHYEFMAPDGENELETINRLLDIAEEEITEKKYRTHQSAMEEIKSKYGL
ncbi:hypothetical protein C943_03430 [Mariniradius saccharolyticus AK6]|uniref:Uncharacterized protein n=1 Tax=Mariniradius saccharolyticus AK6 TaxID=1239962 RepID=M7XJL8_9BACT|nr:hypothetical protein [Mariniradius saccharolyticus]EMS34743.1 hypothetical protein C943_03430 [Mariniradius saccharolyticus AK6]